MAGCAGAGVPTSGPDMGAPGTRGGEGTGAAGGAEAGADPLGFTGGISTLGR
jgi:hypothetical protein